MASKPVICAFHLFLGLFYVVFGDKVAEKIYRDLKGIAPCVILTNATHQIGCTSGMNGHVGVLHYVEGESDVNWILNGDKAKHAPYIPIFRSDQFDPKLLKPLVENKKINGALIIAVKSGKHRYVPSKKEGFSPDYTCPLDGFGTYKDSEYAHCKNMKWNKDGNRLSFSFHNIPMFALYNEQEVEEILECYNQNNNQSEPVYPLCAAELKDFMFAAKDTPTCMRKTRMPNPIGSEFCQPLGDWNVWGTLYPIEEPLKEKDVVMLATKLDSSSFFHDLAPGVDNDGTGVVVALAVANALGGLKREGSVPATKKHIMFTFFQGESWDYIGSSRMVYDMEKGQFPGDDETWKVKGEKFRMNTANIKYFMELNQVGLLDDNTLWAHSDPVSRNNDSATDKEVKNMLSNLTEVGSKFNLTIGDPSENVSQPLPPASFQRFLRSNNKIPGLVLTDHKAEYTNKFYNSRFDDLYQAGGNFSKENDTIYLITEFTKRLSKVASVVATALFTLANDGEPPKEDIKVDDAVVGHLAFCFFNRSNCPLYKEVYSEDVWKQLAKYNQPLPRYVSVNTTNSTFTTTVFHILLYFTGYHIPTTDNCESSEGVIATVVQGKFGNGTCVKGPVHVSPALSPAFVLEQYSSTEYSTWAESTWSEDLSVRIFLVASPALEGVTLASGLIITLLSFGIVYFVHKKADVIFTPADSPSPDLDG